MRRSPLSHSLAVLRITIGLTQKEMGDLVDRAARTIQSIELRKMPLTQELALRIADATGVDEAWLFAGDPDAPPRKGLTLIQAGRWEGDYTKADYEYYRAYVDTGFWDDEQRRAIREKAKAEGKLGELNEIHLRKLAHLDKQLEVIDLIDAALKNELALILTNTKLSDHMRLVRWKIRQSFEDLVKTFSLDIPKTDIAGQALKLATPLAHSNPNGNAPVPPPQRKPKP